MGRSTVSVSVSGLNVCRAAHGHAGFGTGEEASWAGRCAGGAV